jgi:hypothetical protein
VCFGGSKIRDSWDKDVGSVGVIQDLSKIEIHVNAYECISKEKR